jgi:predicted RNA-binding protein Jag
MIDEEQCKSLEEAANRLAEYVEQTGRKVRVLGAAPPTRKVMHTALNDRDSVENTSEGFGMFRHLIVQPVGEKIEEEAPEATEETEQEEV